MKKKLAKTIEYFYTRPHFRAVGAQPALERTTARKCGKSIRSFRPIFDNVNIFKHCVPEQVVGAVG